METKNVIHELRTKNGMSQDELAEKLYVTRQAVSRWETGETVPNTETLKLLSKLFDVSINTLLGSPRKLVCQCCGMPLEDSLISRERDGGFNEEYCKWCYADGKFVYTSIEELTEFLVGHMSNDSFPPEQARAYFEAQLPQLDYWKKNKT
ncbi:MAG: zinc ribbon domain-containing protein [Huintestinicola sp.]